jgi:hypothetical protein
VLSKSRDMARRLDGCLNIYDLKDGFFEKEKKEE